MTFSTSLFSRAFNGGAIALAVTGTIAIVQPASATTFSFDWDRPDVLQTSSSCATTCFKDPSLPLGFNDRIGQYESISTSYNDVTGALSWSSTFSAYDDKLPEGAWLVLTDGPNPKGESGEAIFYLDGLSGTLTAYGYDGNNSRTSYNTQPLLESWENVVSLVDNGDERTLSFDNIDVSSLGVDTGFSEKIGIWFHAVEEISPGVVAQYNNGEIEAFGGAGSWFDTGAMDTDVPEPTVGLLGLGVAALGLKRRRKQTADA